MKSFDIAYVRNDGKGIDIFVRCVKKSGKLFIYVSPIPEGQKKGNFKPPRQIVGSGESGLVRVEHK